MSKFIIHCSTTTSYTLVVDAPNEEAVYKYYESADGTEFQAGTEGGWKLDDISPKDDSTGFYPDSTIISIDEDGEVSDA